MIEKGTNEYKQIEKQIQHKLESGRWDVEAKTLDGEIVKVIDIIQDYANAAEGVTKGRYKAFDAATELLTIECFRFGTAKDKEKLEPEDIDSFKAGDEKYVYNAPVTSQPYKEKCVEEGRGAENRYHLNHKGELEYAIAIHNPARKNEDIYAVLVHEFTHYIAVSYRNEKVEEFMKEHPEVFVSEDNLLKDAQGNSVTDYEVYGEIEEINGKKFCHAILGVERDDDGRIKGAEIERNEKGEMTGFKIDKEEFKVNGILYHQMDNVEWEKGNPRRKVNNRLTEGFTEKITHLLLKNIYGKNFEKIGFEMDKYADEVEMAEKYFFEKGDDSAAVYEYMTNAQGIVKELEAIETEKGNDLFHEITGYLNDFHDYQRNLGKFIHDFNNPQFRDMMGKCHNLYYSVELKKEDVAEINQMKLNTISNNPKYADEIEQCVASFFDFYQQRNNLFEEFQPLRQEIQEENFFEKDLVMIQDMQQAYDETTADRRQQFLKDMKDDMKLENTRESENVK